MGKQEDKKLKKRTKEKRVKMITPRPYQQEAHDAVIRRWKDGITRQVISLPTASGKTLLFGMIAKTLRKRTIIVAHREELLQQAVEKIKMIMPDANIGILQGSNRDGLYKEICVASIQTAVRHIPELQTRHFQLAVCDEAHHIVANTYKKVFRSLGFLNDNPEKLLIGVTATAFRADDKQLGEIFQEVSYKKSIISMIREGYLSDIKGLSVETTTDISSVKTRVGDFAVDELAVAVDTPERNKIVVDTYKDYGENRRGVVFAVKVDHAVHLAEEFRKQGVSCEAVYGDMPSEQRYDILKRYSEGKIQIITNVAILTEGWDAPFTDIIMLARPTKSKGLLIQEVGRGLRTAPGKKNCLIIDFVDVTKKHDLCGLSVLYNDDKDKSIFKTRERKEREGDRATEKLMPIQETILGTYVTEVDFFDRSKFTWQELGKHFRIWMADGSSVCCYSQDDGKYLPIVVSSNGRCEHLSDTPLSMGYALGVCEDYVRHLDSKLADASSKDASWKSYPATEKQLNALDMMKIAHDEGITRGEASELLAKQMNVPPTPAQMWTIQKNQLHDLPELLTKAEASKIIKKFKEGK